MRVDQRFYRFLLSQKMLTIIKDTANLNYGEGPSIKTYAPRWRGGMGGSSLLYISIAFYMQKKKKKGGGGVQIA